MEEHLRASPEQRLVQWNDRNKSPNYNIPKSPATTKTAEELVNQLGAREYKDREVAATILDGMHYAAIPALKEGLQSTDPEIVSRTEGLITKIALRSVLVPGKQLLETEEKLSSPLHPLPNNWSELSDKFLQQAKKINLALVSELYKPFAPADEREEAQIKLGNIWEPIEQKDLCRLIQIAQHPELELAKLIVDRKQLPPSAENHARMEKVTQLLIKELENGTSIFDPNLLIIAALSNSIENRSFFNSWREILIKMNPQFQTANDEQVREHFTESADKSVDIMIFRQNMLFLQKL